MTRHRPKEEEVLLVIEGGPYLVGLKGKTNRLAGLGKDSSSPAGRLGGVNSFSSHTDSREKDSRLFFSEERNRGKENGR